VGPLVGEVRAEQLEVLDNLIQGRAFLADLRGEGRRGGGGAPRLRRRRKLLTPKRLQANPPPNR